MIRASIFWHVWFAFCCLQTDSSRAEKPPQEVVGILGESATFHLEIPASFKQIFWRTNVTLATVMPPCKLDVYLEKYKGRLNLSQDCRTFTVTHLRKEDSGIYQAEIALPDPNPTVKNFRLQVYKRLSEDDLKVVCAKHVSSDGNETWQLNCSVPGWEDGVGYSWTLGEVFSPGRSLVILQGLQDSNENVTCRAANPVSNTSKTVSLKQSCGGGEQLTATRPVTMATMEPGNENDLENRLPAWAIPVGIIAAVFAVLLVSVILWQMKKAAPKTFTTSATHSEPDESTKTIYSQIENIPEPRESEKLQQRRGLNASDEVLQTVYITVQHPKETPLQTDDEKMQKGKWKPRAESEKTVYSEITKQQETEDQTPKTIYETVKLQKPPDGKEYNKIL